MISTRMPDSLVRAPQACEKAVRGKGRWHAHFCLDARGGPHETESDETESDRIRDHRRTGGAGELQRDDRGSHGAATRTSRFIQIDTSVESGHTTWRFKGYENGTWRADDTTVTKVFLPDYAFEPSAVVEHVKSYRFEDDGDTLVMTHWAEDGPTVTTMRELRYTRVPETSIIGSWVDSFLDFDDRRIETSVQVLEDGTFSFVATVTPDGGDASVTSVSGRYTDDPDENFITLSDVTQTLNDVPVPAEEGMRFAYASGYGDDELFLSSFHFESNPDDYPYGEYDIFLSRESP